MMYEVITGRIAYDGMAAMDAAKLVVQRALRPNMPGFVPEEYWCVALQYKAMVCRTAAAPGNIVP